jgi:hypothetical protein
MKAIFGFLHALHEALWEAFNNGRKSDVRPYQFILPPEPAVPGESLSPGEQVFREDQAVLFFMKPDAGELQAEHS